MTTFIITVKKKNKVAFIKELLGYFDFIEVKKYKPAKKKKK
jgi:hypothetical protein